MSKNNGDKLFAIMLIAPTFLITFFFIIIPVIDSIFKSFLQFKLKNIISGVPGVWNNFKNYTSLFENSKMTSSIITTFIFVISLVVLQFILGMTLAIILNSNVKGARFLRSIMMTPWIVPTIISALVWMWIFQPQYGLLKYIVTFITNGRVTEFAILNNPKTALLGVSVAALWKQIPLTTLLLLAGLQNVPEEILESATVDGANNKTKFFSIVIPYMASIIKITMSMAIIENFKQFPLFWTMTGGGPENSTTTLAILSYREAFVSNNLGSGAAVTTIWMGLMVIVVYLYNRAFKSESMD